MPLNESGSAFSLEIVTQCAYRLNEIQEEKRIVENYDPSLKPKPSDEPPNPAITYLNNEIFPALNTALIDLLHKVKENDYLHKRRNTFNATDYISEYLWNMNKRCPERKENWTYIFDTEWVQTYLEEKPFYPLSVLWTEDFAAVKIQTYVRGFLVRKQRAVQELREFWEEERKRLRLIREERDDSIVHLLKTGLIQPCTCVCKCPEE